MLNTIHQFEETFKQSVVLIQFWFKWFFTSPPLNAVIAGGESLDRFQSNKTRNDLSDASRVGSKKRNMHHLSEIPREIVRPLNFVSVIFPNCLQPIFLDSSLQAIMFTDSCFRPKYISLRKY